MKRLLLPVLTLPFLFLVPVACEDKPPVSVAPQPPAPRKKPKIYSAANLQAEAAARQAALDKEIADLENEAEKLRLEIAQEQLAQDQASLAKELARLESERTRLLQSLAQTTPQPTAALPPDKPKASPVYPITTTTTVADFSLFYTELTTHGSWFQSVDYGYVWQPTVARQTSWRPYTQGRWASCDRGWIWLSEEPFGWATYHYGRWACLKDIGWIWVPGETWGPAWVAWRKNDEHIGWCPLPPETLHHGEITYDANVDKLCGLRPDRYIFIAIKRFCEPVQRHCEPPDRSPVICRSTTNITRLQVTRRGVERCGPSYDWIRARLTGDQPRYVLTGLPQRQRHQHYHFRNNQLCVFSPVMRAPWNPTLQPPQVAGSVPSVPKSGPDAPAPDKLRQRYREGRQAWETAALRAMKEAPVRRLTERQESITTRQAALAQAAQSRPGSDLPLPVRQTPNSATSPTTSGTQTTAQRREIREAARQELAQQKAALARLRGEPDPTPAPPPRLVTAAPVSRPQPTKEAPATPRRIPATNPPDTVPVSTPVLPTAVAETSDVVQAGNLPAQPPPPVMEQPAALVAGNPDIPSPEIPPADLPDASEPPDAPEPPDATELDRQDRIAELKEEIAHNRQTLQRPAPVNPTTGTRQPDRPRPDREDRNLTSSRQEETRQAAVARAADLRAQQAELQAQQADLLARQQEAAQQKAEQDQAAQAQQQADAANLQAQQDALTQQQTANALEARRQQAQQEKELSDRQRLAEEQSRQQQDLAEQQQQQQERQDLARQQQEVATRQRQAEEAAQQQEVALQQQEAAERQRQAEEAARQQEMARQQQEAAEHQRQAEEAARQQEMARQQQEAAERQRQAEEAARQQELARQQQEAAERQRQAEEAARQQELARQAQEAAERQRQAQEAARQAQEAAERQRQAEEAARRQQEAAERARQEEANRQQKEKEQGGRQ